jgi:exonuclease VII large subunit
MAEEGNVNWDAAKTFLSGKAQEGAGDGNAGANDAPPFVEVSIKGRKVRMTKEAAEAYNEVVRETRERDSRLGGEIAQLRERSARLEGAVSTLRTPTPTGSEEIAPPDPALARSDWEEYHRQMTAYNVAINARTREELRAEYQTDLQRRESTQTEASRIKAWGDKFYESNADLNKPHFRPVVQSVYAEHAAEINGFGDDIAGAHERLAELAKERLLAIHQDLNPETDRPLALEGSGVVKPGAGVKPIVDRKEPVTAASWSARKRAALRGGK